MTKILKKSLACLLAFVLCFTAIAGCLSVSAEAPALTCSYQIYANSRADENTNVGRVCVGETLRSEVTVHNLTAGVMYGVKIQLPEGISNITYNGFGTASCQVEPDGEFFDEETNVYTLVYLAGTSGSWHTCIYYKTTDAMQKNHVYPLTAKVEAATDSVDMYKYSEVCNIEVFDHDVVVQEAVAPGCETTGLTEGSYCSRCEDVFVAQEEVEATGHKYVDGVCSCGAKDPDAVVPCAHANKTFVSAQPAVNGGPIGSITFKCDDCGETLDPEDVTYLVQSSLTTAAVECNAQTKFFLRTSAALYANSTEGILVITRKFANGVAPQTIVLTMDDAIAPDVDDSNYRWLFGVGTVNFCDEFVTQLYTKRNGAWVSGLERTYSVKAAAESVINGSADSKTKKIAANLLKMGEETQKAFNIAVDKLPTAGLDDTGLGYITNTAPSIVKDGTTNFIGAPSSFIQDKKAAIAQPKIAMQDSLTMTFNTSFAYYEGPKDDVKVKYTYIAANGVEVNNYLVGSWTNANVCAFELAIPAPNLRCPVTMQIFNGDVAISDTVTYSVEGVLAHVLSTTPKYQAAMNAILNYSDSTR